MNRLTTGTLLGAAAAGALAWALGGSLGTGLLGGFLLGASLSGFGFGWQVRLLRTKPEAAMRAGVVVFLVKLACLAALAPVLRYVGPVAERADWRAFLLGFAAAALLALPLGSMEVLRATRRRRAA